MVVSYCKTDKEAESAIRSHAELGYRPAAFSALGCPPGTFRITFLPETSFTDGKTAKRALEEALKRRGERED